jgi:hypothetical protein
MVKKILTNTILLMTVKFLAMAQMCLIYLY